LGWFVGYVRSGAETYIYACELQGAKLSGKEARAAVEQIFDAAQFR